MSDTKADVQAYWNHAAQVWRKWWKSLGPETQPVSDRLVAMAHLQAGHRVLDVATGLGEPAITAARTVGPQGWVLGVDQAEQMIAFARERAATEGLGNLEFRVLDAEMLDIAERDFDAILSRWGLMFFADLPGGLARLRACLRPGGWLAAAIWAAPEQVPMCSLAGREIRRALPGPFPEPDRLGPFALAEPGLLARRMTEAGFSDVWEEPVTVVSEYHSAEEFAESRRDLCGSTADLLAGCSPEEQERAWQAVIEGARAYQTPGGLVRLENQAICVAGRA